MANSETTEHEDEHFQDVVSQFPLLNAYTNYLGFFKPSQTISRDAVTAALRSAFEELKTNIPWLESQVVNTGEDPGSSGRFRLSPWPDGIPRKDFYVEDRSRSMASLEELHRAGFPISMIRTEALEPWPPLPTPATISPAPVVALQLSFICGGVVLTISCHHTMIDGTGIIAFRRLLAALLSGKGITDEDVVGASMDRRKVIPLWTGKVPIKDHSHLIRRPQQQPEAIQTLQPTPKAEWCLFRIRRKAVEEILSLANDRRSPSWMPTVSHISTNDALAAFCWQRITAARLPIILGRRHCGGEQGYSPYTQKEELLTRFGRAIDVRRIMGVPPSYMGHMVYHASLWLPFSAVISAPLPYLACALRRALEEVSNPWSISSYATFLARQSDRSALMYGGPHNGETDLGLSSVMTALDWNSDPSMDFGPLLGRSVMWRKANGPPVPGCIYFLEMERDARDVSDGKDLAQTVLLCLPVDELKALKRDVDWTKYFEPVVEPSLSLGADFGHLSKL